MIPKNIGATITTKYVGGGTATAGGTGDATKVTGEAVDLLGFKSGVLAIAYTTTLAAGKKLSFAVEREGSADNSTFATAVEIQASTQAATSAAGGTVTGVVEIDLNFDPLKRYQKFNITPDLDATGTDTCAWRAIVICGGKDVNPT